MRMKKVNNFTNSIVGIECLSETAPTGSTSEPISPCNIEHTCGQGCKYPDGTKHR